VKILPEWIEQRSMPVTECGCWIWMMCIHREGYGLSKKIRGNTRAHRISWIAHNGPIPAGLNVLHHCDIPACVNPDHLFLGTHQDNVADKMKKHRAARGTDHGLAKLNEQQVAEIRASDLSHRGSQRKLARQYGVDKALIRAIRRREIWRHVP